MKGKIINYVGGPDGCADIYYDHEERITGNPLRVRVVNRARQYEMQFRGYSEAMEYAIRATDARRDREVRL